MMAAHRMHPPGSAVTAPARRKASRRFASEPAHHAHDKSAVVRTCGCAQHGVVRASAIHIVIEMKC